MSANQRLDRGKKILEQYMIAPDYQEKLTQRLKINDSCLRSEQSKMLTASLCADDPIFFINNFGWTFDPRPEREPHHFPFILYDFQEDLVNDIVKRIKSGEDGLYEKSRDMGATWVFMWVFVWLWLFDDSFSGLIGSYKEVLVDDRTKESLFGKIDYALENIPRWMLPKRFNMNKHRQKLKLINPENQNLISGDTMNPDFGRGSRRTVVFMDEGASWDYFREAWESTGDVTPSRLTVSTPKGRNAFSLLRESGIDVTTIHWKLHPLKDEAWYEYEKSRRTPEEVAQELDISYHKSQEGRVYPEWDEVEHGVFEYDAGLPLYVSWDFGQTDDTAIIWWQETGDRHLNIVDAYANRGKTIDFYVPFVTGMVTSDIADKYTDADLEIVSRHGTWQRGIHFGDPSGRFTNQVVNTSVIQVLRDNGIVVNFKEDAKDFQTRKTHTKHILPRVRVNNNPRTIELSIAMENARYPKVRGEGQEEFNTKKPRHDWTSHYRSSVEYFAVNYNVYRGKSMHVKDKFPVRTGRRAIRY